MRLVRDKITKQELIGLYEHLLDEGRIEECGSAHRRLKYLKKKEGKGFNILDWKSNVSE